MAAFVLVHGGWHGGWCWKKVAPLLRAAGHDVHTPTLTGLGERAHLARPDIDLDTHLTDIANLLAYEELADVVLVGHSYAGIVIAGVAARVAHLVYLDAFVPGDGQALLDLIPSDAAARLAEQARAEGDGWRVPPGPPERYGVTDLADIAWVGPKLVAHPFGTFKQPVWLGHSVPPAATFILCTGRATPHLVLIRTAERVRDEPGWRYRELPTGHDAMITMPRATADLLLEVAALPEVVAAGKHIAP
jgi:pimeloyl-ACP methyl ester carboxylesterase